MVFVWDGEQLGVSADRNGYYEQCYLS